MINNSKFFPEGTTTNDLVYVDNSLSSIEPLLTDNAPYATPWMKKVPKRKMTQMLLLMNQFAHSLVMCVKLWLYFEYACYLVNGEFIHKCSNDSVLVEKELSAKLG